MGSLDKPYQIGLVVGENSGDALAAGFMRAWLLRYPNTIFSGVGGPRMCELGFKSLVPMEELNVMGLIEPLKRFPRLIKIYNTLKKHFLDLKIDCFIGVDYQEFNLSLERALKTAGIRTIHYVGPTLWAWRPNRIFKVKAAADHVLVLFPFETPPYIKHQVPVTFVGHPFADEIPIQAADLIEARKSLGLSETQTPILAVLPGSRRQEIALLAAPFAAGALRLKAQVPNLKIICAAVHQQAAEQCKAIFQTIPGAVESIEVIIDRARAIISASNFVLLASGTATLETLLLKKPMVVGYRVGRLTYWLAQKLIKLRNIALPNILAGKTLVPELLQNDLTPENICAALMNYFQDPSGIQNQLKQDFEEIHGLLKKDASQMAVLAIEKMLLEKNMIK